MNGEWVQYLKDRAEETEDRIKSLQLEHGIGDRLFYKEDILDLFYNVVFRKDQDQGPKREYFENPVDAFLELLHECVVTGVNITVGEPYVYPGCTPSEPLKYEETVSYNASNRKRYPYRYSDPPMNLQDAMNFLINHFNEQIGRLKDVVEEAYKTIEKTQ